MATEPETVDNIPNEVEHVSIEGAPEGSELVETPEGTEPEGTEPEAPEATPPGPKEQIVRRQPSEPVANATDDGTERLPGETPQVYALRQELTKTRALLRGERAQELIGGIENATAPVAKPVAPQNEEILKKYKPAEIAAVEEVVKALGYVKADQLQTATYGEKGQAQLDSFLEKHPEYSAEKDPTGALWKAFREEFAIYKQPADPKDFTRIFNKVHASVFGIQPQGADGRSAAAIERVASASRGSAPAPSNTTTRTRVSSPGTVRTDMLKGFTAEEMADMGL
jgi:hypothetical protein